MNYDLVIIGAGPTGLTLAQCLRQTYGKILIIEKEDVIGGLHRVLRVPYNNDMIFTEHSPRVYSNSYKNFQMILKDMKHDFYRLFTPYNFSIFEIGGQTIFSTLSLSELVEIGLQFVCLIFNNKYGINTTVLEFMTKHNFSEKSKSLIDRMARLTDGAGADRFTLNEFLQIFNQQFFYKLYQPKIPNDQGLFKIWGDFLTENGISIMTNTSVQKINYNTSLNLATSVESVDKDGNRYVFNAEKIVIALPPESMLPILENSSHEIQNSFMKYEELKSYSEKTDYNIYISFTFHWNQKLTLPKVYGFPRSEWGIAFIILSDYMHFTEETSKTVFSCTITYTDVKSSFTNKTANESTKDEIISESLRQLNESFPDLPTPTLSILSPEMYYQNGRWNTTGEAFITASNAGFLPFSNKISNLYNVGTHNGKCKYAFTSMETAVANAIYLAGIMDPGVKKIYRIKNIFTIRNLVLIIILSILIIMFIK